MSERVSIVGDGQMGIVLAWTLAQRGVPCALWGPFERDLEALRRERRSPRMPSIELPPSVEVTADAGAALAKCTIAVNAIPTQFIASAWKSVAPSLPRGALLVSVAKGFEAGTHRLPSSVLRSAVGRAESTPVVVLTGPTIAAELARRLPATMLAACADADGALRVQAAFAAPWIRIYTHDDPIGAEVAGALKNVIAIAAGIVDGLELGFNAKSALLARGLVEMVRLGTALGAKAETFFGIAGVGDLATTCFSPEGRNRSCGEALGRGETLERHLASTRSVVEGVETARSVVQFARERAIEVPIMDAVSRILFEGLPAREAIRELMTREPKEERIA
ncbi:MAG: NAD(P)-dependent glycerol-3-phosphate dehydrogenase [Phycisphaerae bacterium]|nr:NAD(P)-dependent glycerol-3-phosphate dehydrogenase [Phycisphaerae bacterium]